jgi:hypothetical protein
MILKRFLTLNNLIMKTRKLLTILLGLFVAAMIISCENNDDIVMPEGSILPESFKVDIPDALSRQGTQNARVAVDTLDGNVVYMHLTNFIHVGEEAAEIVEAEIVEDIIKSIVLYGINKPMSLSFEGEDDGRTKNLDVIETSFFDGVEWEFELNITDAASEGNEDGGKAIQIFWNRNPIKGIAILKPYNIDRDDHMDAEDAIFNLEYSEAGDHGYDAHMIIQAANLPLEEPLDNPYSVNAMKMFVGKKGDIIDVYGNTNHPNAVLFGANVGFNWAFVASGNNNKDIGVAEVGLPSSNLDEPSRNILLEQYSIKNVFTNEIFTLWPNISPDIVNAYLHNTEAPGFFSKYGFVQGGTSPGQDYDELEVRLPDLSPYNPKEIANLFIDFK